MKLRLNKYLHLIINIILPILLGTLIYIVYRTDDLIMFNWLSLFGFQDSVNYIRNNNIFSQAPFWFKYNFSDGLWIYSFTNMIFLLWIDNINKSNFYYIYFFTILACVFELLQFFEIFPGTYDFSDILFYLIFGFLPFLFLSKK